MWLDTQRYHSTCLAASCVHCGFRHTKQSSPIARASAQMLMRSRHHRGNEGEHEASMPTSYRLTGLMAYVCSSCMDSLHRSSSTRTECMSMCILSYGLSAGDTRNSDSNSAQSLERKLVIMLTPKSSILSFQLKE